MEIESKSSRLKPGNPEEVQISTNLVLGIGQTLETVQANWSQAPFKQNAKYSTIIVHSKWLQ